VDKPLEFVRKLTMDGASITYDTRHIRD